MEAAGRRRGAEQPRAQHSRGGLHVPVPDGPVQRRPGRSVRGDRANFTRLVIGCVEPSKQASKQGRAVPLVEKEKRRDPGMRVQLKYT